MNVPVWYLEKKHKANRIEEIQHDYHIGQFNPAIVDLFVSKYLKTGNYVWEPFAGHMGQNKTIDIANKYGVTLIAYDLEPCDSRVEAKNSLVDTPAEEIDGIIFHPPYYGTSPMSSCNGEISLSNDYWNVLREFTIKIKAKFVCVVGRTIVIKGQRYPLDWLYSQLFIENGYKIIDIFGSPPDWVIILEKING